MVEGVIVEEVPSSLWAYTLVRAPVFTTVNRRNPLRSRSGRICGCFRQSASKDGKYSLYCAVIVKKVDAKLAAKSALTNCCVPSTKSMQRAARRCPIAFWFRIIRPTHFPPPFLNTFSSCFGLSCNSQTKINVLIHPMEYRHNKAGNF